ncbi:YozE family protein [Fundicoccus sp. Sow4_D5]|uniref:YozE family protein n=1 Tax=unclassified Fundicoccus TaxID=2761543 RepID=UPI003F93AC56
MKPTFYEYIRRYVDHDAKDPMSRLANAIHKDIAFPKQSKSFDEVSTYLEQSIEYTKLLVIFDEAWHNYTYE